ncbi:reverse transcriptase domain-containing protein [Microbacterium betulae]|uniref:Reverse transcriptase domain-containing protein n=1 Tax=Microbacterium betulae TaxID=2981139 RepID=A0AA97FDQ8_9MICO|nr:reverse transcriptase domain-containing protein [Microbacterium sp. AB]WOF21671.1 reverse transcriptase domain-containing protein [Microbacterium sp. AB]
MRLSPEFAKSLRFEESAKEVVSRPLLELPLLISERALVDGVDVLAGSAEAMSIAGHTPTMDVIAMPKRGYGPRPIGILSPVARTIYESIVGRLQPHLPKPSREQGIHAHRAFGVDPGRPSEVRIVDVDIAACYEYVDHRILADEILMQSLDHEASRSLSDLLGDLFPRAVGIPQAMSASHLLADVYLDRVERGIRRGGYEVNRFADDFRVISQDWASAHHAIELVVEEARSLGLTLADGKTRIHSVKQLQEAEEEREALLDGYRSRAADNLRSMEFVQVGYEDFELEEIDAPDDEVDFAALKGIVEDWVQGDPEQRTLHATFGSRALRVLRAAPERLPDDWLLEIVAREPPHLRNVLVYLRARPEHRENWATVARLVALPRTSSWARIWLLRMAETLTVPKAADRVPFDDWAQLCLKDRSEVVRAEAAWALSHSHAITAEQLADLFVESTSITRCGVSAVVGKLDGEAPSKLGKAMQADSQLVRAAYEWGSVNAG